MAISLITGHATGQANASSLAVAYGQNNAAGNLLVAMAYSYKSATNVTLTIADSAGNSWTQAIRFDDSGGPFLGNQYIWYVPSSIAGANTVTITPSVSSEMILHVSEWSGADTSTPLDKTASGSDTTGAPTTGSATTTTDGQLVVGFLAYNNAISGQGSGFSLLDTKTGTTFDSKSEYQIQSAQGAIAANWTAAGNNRYGAVMATFKAAAGGGGSPLFGFSRLVGLGSGGPFFQNPLN